MLTGHAGHTSDAREGRASHEFIWPFQYHRLSTGGVMGNYLSYTNDPQTIKDLNGSSGTHDFGQQEAMMEAACR